MTSERRARIGQLYDRFGARLAAVVAARFRLPGDVSAEAVQDIFLRLLQRSDLADRVLALSGDEAFRYLLTTVRHDSIRELRRRAEIELRPESVLERILVARGAAVSPHAPEVSELVRVEVARLPELYREVLDRLLFRRQSASEIAEALGRPVNTIYQQIHRGLGQLRTAVALALQR